MTLESTPAEDLRMDVKALWAVLWSRMPRILIVTALLLVATFVILMFVPKMYESSASILVEDRSNTYTSAAVGTPQQGSGVSLDALISSQIELIKSRDTLLAVIDSQNLRSVPEFNGSAGSPLSTVLTLIGRKSHPKSVDETVLQNLNDRLTVIRERDSAVVSVYVRTTDPQLSAKIANAIAAEDVKRRAGQSVSDTAEATAWLQQQIEQLRGKVQEADSKVADYKAKNGIFAGANGTSLPDQQISDIGKQITDAQQAKGNAEQRAALIRSMLKSGQPVEGVQDVRDSAVVQALMQNRATLKSELAEKLATLLPGHPTIIALKAQISQVDAQIRAEARRIADGLDAQVKVQAGLIQSLNNDLARAKLAASSQTKDSVTLDSLTREAKADRDLLDSYLLKYRDASGRTTDNAVLPDVRIITAAAPSVVPASPKTTLTLAAVGFVSLALQVGMVLFGELMSGRAVYDPRLRAGTTEPEIVPDTAAPTDEEPEFDFVAASAPPDEPTDEFVAVTAAVEMPSAPEEEPEEEPEQEQESDIGDVIVAASPVAEPVFTPAPRHSTAASSALELSNLSADIAIGRARIVLLAGLADARDAALVADRLVSDALTKGMSVCRVDAGSGHLSTAPGLTDLCAETVSFGDVVHKVREGLAEVPWGHLPALDRRSMRGVTLIEALADIYESVVISTGRIGLGSNLPLFAGVRGRLVLVRQRATPPAQLEATMADCAAVGFESVQAVTVSEPETAVA